MTPVKWFNEFPADITVCDATGTILEMNESAAGTFRAQGGTALVGTNVLDCHPEPSRTKLRQLLTSGQANTYTVEKHGARKLVYQAPWFERGELRGLIEIAIPLPEHLPHLVRDE